MTGPKATEPNVAVKCGDTTINFDEVEWYDGNEDGIAQLGEVEIVGDRFLSSEEIRCFNEILDKTRQVKIRLQGDDLNNWPDVRKAVNDWAKRWGYDACTVIVSVGNPKWDPKTTVISMEIGAGSIVRRALKSVKFEGSGPSKEVAEQSLLRQIEAATPSSVPML